MKNLHCFEYADFPPDLALAAAGYCVNWGVDQSTLPLFHRYAEQELPYVEAVLLDNKEKIKEGVRQGIIIQKEKQPFAQASYKTAGAGRNVVSLQDMKEAEAAFWMMFLLVYKISKENNFPLNEVYLWLPDFADAYYKQRDVNLKKKVTKTASTFDQAIAAVMNLNAETVPMTWDDGALEQP